MAIADDLIASIRSTSQRVLQEKSLEDKTWPRVATVPVPHNYRETVVSRKPLSYWRLGEQRNYFARDEMRYSNGKYMYEWYNGLEYVSAEKVPIFQNAPLVVDDGDLSTKFEWDTDFLYNLPRGNFVSIPHRTNYVGMSTLLMEFFVKLDLPKGNYGSLISKTEETTSIDTVIYREHRRVTVDNVNYTKQYDAIDVSYDANTPFVLECDVRMDWDGVDDKYIVAFADDEATDIPNWNYGISNQQLFSHPAITDTPSELVQGTNYHLKLVYDGTDLEVYLDGVLRNTRSVSIPASTQVRIGSYHHEAFEDDFDWFIGEISNFKLTFNPTSMPAYYVGIDNSKMKAIVSNGSSSVSVQSSSSIIDQEWHYVVVLFKNQELKIYIDDVLEGTSAVLGSDYIFPANESPIEIAKSMDQSQWTFFQGCIDEVALYNWDWYS
jgi:hypothetical protein